MAIDFPATPSNGQIYTDPTTGNRYQYISDYTYWSYFAANTLGPSSNTQVIFNDSGYANGSAGLIFNKTTNNLVVANTTNSAAFTVGALFTANSTLVNAAAINVTGQTNTATLFVTTSANISTFLVTNSTAVTTTVNNSFGGTNTAISSNLNLTGTFANLFGIVANSTGVYASDVDILYVGNTTTNATHNSSSFFITGNTTTRATATLTTSGLTVGNSSTTQTGSIITIANSAGNVQITPAGFTGNGFSLTSINATSINNGTLLVNYGGTGATTLTGIVKGNGTSAFTAATAGTDYNVITRATAVTASGAAVDFSSLPSTARRITLQFTGLSTNGTLAIGCQLGISGVPVVTGYTGSCFTANTTATAIQTVSTSVFLESAFANATASRHGTIFINNITGNSYIISGSTSRSDANTIHVFNGAITLNAPATFVRLTMGGTDVFDAGTVNIFYE